MRLHFLRKATIALAIFAATGCGSSEGAGAIPGDASGGAPLDGGVGGGGAGGAGGTGGSAGGVGGSAGDADGGLCSLEPKGPAFVIHVHNAGTGPLVLPLGCGRSIPIVLDTPRGMESIGPGADVCEHACELTYAGQPGRCTDCGGGGYVKPIAAGATADIEWDRRIYAKRQVPPACGEPGTCAFGLAVPPSKTQTGVITVCPGLDAGSCRQSSKMINFTIDTTSNQGTVEVM